ncbi:serine/threonine-protein kinase, active site protein [Artemisia annua]|nr:serine/threonine-protein kinase, active site protein [Artemisia annua]
MRIELHRFSNLKEEANFDAFLKGFSEYLFKNAAIYVEGVEFQPISKMTHEEIKELKKVNMAAVELSATDEDQLEVNSAS